MKSKGLDHVFGVLLKLSDGNYLILGKYYYYIVNLTIDDIDYKNQIRSIMKYCTQSIHRFYLNALTSEKYSPKIIFNCDKVQLEKYESLLPSYYFINNSF